MIDLSHLLRPAALAASIASTAFGAPAGAAEPIDRYGRVTEAAPARCSAPTLAAAPCTMAGSRRER
jgi:hypothetical protein